MAYATVAELREYLDITGTGDDDLLLLMLDAVTAAIDRYTLRTFAATADTTRTFDAYADSDGRTLMLDEDLCAITTITNGDNVAVGATQYTTEPRNRTPYYAIKLKLSAGKIWETDNNGDAEDAISITGKWAYSLTPPYDIQQACLQWGAYLYRQKDSQVFDVTATPETGTMTIPKGIPATVKKLLDPLRRL